MEKLGNMWDAKEPTNKNKNLKRLEEVEFGTKSKSKKYVNIIEDDNDNEDIYDDEEN